MNDAPTQYRFTVSDKKGPDALYLHLSPRQALLLAEHLLKVTTIQKDTVSIPVFGRMELPQKGTR